MSAVESWFAPAAAAVAEPLPRKRSPRRSTAASPPKPRATRRVPAAASARPKAQRRSFRVRLPLVWMVVFAVLLVGVVAVNVAVLRANVSVNNLDKKIAQLQQGNANLASQYSSTTAAPQVEAAARRDRLIPAGTPTLLNMGGNK